VTTVLFTCAGQRVDIVSAFGRAGAHTVAVDIDPLAPALYHADRHALVPRVGDPAYVPVLAELVREHEIRLIVSLADQDHITLAHAREALEPVVAEHGIRAVAEDPEMGKVSVVGAGMKTHPGVAAKVFSTLGDEEINIEMISTSPIKISCVVAGDAVDRAVRALHTAFELGADQVEAEHPFGARA